MLRLISQVYEPPTDDSLCPCSTKSCSVAITTAGVYTFGLADDGGLGYAPLPEMATTVIGGYSRKCQWRPRLVHASWSLLGPPSSAAGGGGAGGGHAEQGHAEWSAEELARVMRQVAVTPTSTHVIASPVSPLGQGGEKCGERRGKGTGTSLGRCKGRNVQVRVDRGAGMATFELAEASGRDWLVKDHRGSVLALSEFGLWSPVHTVS